MNTRLSVLISLHGLLSIATDLRSTSTVYVLLQFSPFVLPNTKLYTFVLESRPKRWAYHTGNNSTEITFAYCKRLLDPRYRRIVC